MSEAGRCASAPFGAGLHGRGIAALYAEPLSNEEPPLDSARRTPASPAPTDLVGLLAGRTAGHLSDLRGVIHDHRAGTVLSPGAIGIGRGDGVALIGDPVTFGRGTAEHREAVWREGVALREARRRPRSAWQPSEAPAWQLAGAGAAMTSGWRPARQRGVWPLGGKRRAATAVITALILLIGAAGSSLAQSRYRVQEGDTLDSIAAEFGVDPAAIAASSYIQAYPSLTAGEVIVIPDPEQSPEEAASEAASVEGSSPFVVGAHVVAAGDTLAAIATAWALDAETLASFNGVDDPENLSVGQRLLIPPSRDGASAPVAAAAAAGVFVPSVGTHLQTRNLSCEYAAAFIATSAFEAGVPEWVFIEQAPQARNPHYGYRGDIDGWWGNTDDYGIYPEALAPILNANGFRADVFYSFGATGDLTSYLDQGIPVVVWLGLWGDTAVTLYDEGTYTVAAGAHVVVAYGYDANGVHVSDPGDGTYKQFGWDEFTTMWSVLDGMAMAVSPY